jgi:16S rRNA (adenine1518-N6/adenine1519-N6)-dimethyltransferase
MQFKYFKIDEIQNFIKVNRLAIQKKFGQNFLVDPAVAEKIVGSVEIGKNDLIIEIGCGLGSLTHKLVDFGCQVIGFEIDWAYIRLLNNTYKKVPNFKLIEGDFLKEVKTLADTLKNEKYEKVHIFGNLPYNITSPILDRIFKTPLYFDEIIFMVQKEVGHRITAKEGSKKYGSLSVFCQYYCVPEIIMDVSSSSFYPVPKVDSSVICLRKRLDPFEVKDTGLFFRVAHSLFMNRRKQIKNNLLISTLLKDIQRDILVKALDNTGIPLSERGENLPISKIAELSNEIYRLIKE